MTRYFITGATGVIGGVITRDIIQSKEYKDNNISISVLVREPNRFHDLYKEYDCNNIQIVEGCLEEDTWYEKIVEEVDFIIHCASPTASMFMITNPIETLDSIVLGTRNILEFAKLKKIKSMVYLSSLEVYGKVNDIGRAREENEIGLVEIDSVRSCYPLGKRIAEHYCYIYAKEHNVPVKIARLAQTFGKGARVEDNRVYMQFAQAVCGKKDIVLKTDGASVGNYCGIEDTVNAILLILCEGKAGEVYNVVNEKNSMCIKEMAQLVAKNIANGSISVKHELEDIDRVGYAPSTELYVSSKKLRQLGWIPQKGLIQMYEDLIGEFKKYK